MKDIYTPCVRKCQVRGDHCIECKRTLNEIAQWSRMNESDRAKIREQLKTREI